MALLVLRAGACVLVLGLAKDKVLKEIRESVAGCGVDLSMRGAALLVGILSPGDHFTKDMVLLKSR